MHVEALIKRSVDKTFIRDEEINVLVLKYPKELKTAKVIRAMLEEELDIEISVSELGYLTMFLCSESVEKEKSRIGLIVISHGKARLAVWQRWLIPYWEQGTVRVLICLWTHR